MGKRHKGRRGRQRGTGPDETKDRSAHRIRAGKKMQTLKALINQAPLENVEAYILALEKESDRSAAIMATAFLERALYVMLNCSIADWGETRRNEWFDGPNAPFRSFSAKIMLAQAIFITGEQTTEQLNRIRNIRNAFAHASSQIDFKTPAIARETSELLRLELPGTKRPERTRFCLMCIWLAREFLQDAELQGSTERRTRFP